MEYHKKFEEEKGQYTAVTNDPEMDRAKKATQQQSNAAYTRQRAGKQNQYYSVILVCLVLWIEATAKWIFLVWNIKISNITSIINP